MSSVKGAANVFKPRICELAKKKAILPIACALACILLLTGCSSANQYIGDWKVIEAFAMYDGTQVDAYWAASGTVEVSKDRMKIDARVDGSKFKEEGSFQGYTEQNRPVYETKNGQLISIGKSNGVYVVVFGNENPSDGAIGLYVKK
ncbi:MAG: hypothetical protein V8R08_05185 [Coriobacteriales bacterium]